MFYALRLFVFRTRKISPLIDRFVRGMVCVAVACISTCALRGNTAAETRSTDFTFVSQGLTLSGIVTQPLQGDAKALIVFVHGYGPTDVRGWTMYADLRTRFAALGIASVTWDKPGQGRSEGTFDINQPVTSSAQEVSDAIAYVRTHQIPGAGNIGIWGISRAGWIAPIVLSQDPSLRFWISVSGVTAEDNYFYLLKSNLPHEGSTVVEADTLMQEWRRGFELFRNGGAYEDYRDATKNLWANAYIRRMAGNGYTRQSYEREQTKLRSAQAPLPIELETGMTVYVHDFDAMLTRLDVDVLALFGEKDLNVDWRKTRTFYEATIGRNPKASLSVRSFPDGNHNIDVSETGSMREMQSMRSWRKNDGYYDTQIDWLRTHVLKEPTSERPQ
jgi:pimeloyl-ACP methyl ester carboxylesterase